VQSEATIFGGVMIEMTRVANTLVILLLEMKTSCFWHFLGTHKFKTKYKEGGHEEGCSMKYNFRKFGINFKEIKISGNYLI